MAALVCSTLWHGIVIPAKHRSGQNAVIHSCKTHKGCCHTILQICKPLGLMSHSNVCLAVKTLTFAGEPCNLLWQGEQSGVGLQR